MKHKEYRYRKKMDLKIIVQTIEVKLLFLAHKNHLIIKMEIIQLSYQVKSKIYNNPI